MRTSVIVSLRIEGLHRWKEAQEVLPQVGFLSNVHRHEFWFEIEVEVEGLNRDIEFINLKHAVKNYLLSKYQMEDICDFGGKSCEMLAKEVLGVFHASRVRVLEDGENGAEVKI